jgi:hypothetical protein
MFLFWFLIWYSMWRDYFAVATDTITSWSLGRQYGQVFSLSLLDVYASVSNMCRSMEQHAQEKVNCCWNTKINFYLETSGGQNYNLYLNADHFLTSVLIRHLWQLKTVVFLHRCLMRLFHWFYITSRLRIS